MFCITLSPIIFVYLKKKDLAFINVITTISAFIIWGCLITGLLDGVGWNLLWNITLLAAALFPVFGLSFIFIRLRQKNSYIITGLILLIIGLCLAIGDVSDTTNLYLVVQYAILYFIPIFVISMVLITLIQYLRKSTLIERKG
ncbi:hypothetical protein [Gracilibacillus dipsosauri]|uniref:hypothetical protein n=1 Tax=Gracilibacillus dipsosauri TaxID=178340 RepID=UPI002409AC49